MNKKNAPLVDFVVHMHQRLAGLASFQSAQFARPPGTMSKLGRVSHEEMVDGRKMNLHGRAESQQNRSRLIRQQMVLSSIIEIPNKTKKVWILVILLRVMLALPISYPCRSGWNVQSCKLISPMMMILVEELNPIDNFMQNFVRTTQNSSIRTHLDQ